MSDIVQRLRAEIDDPIQAALRDEAADEIERLRVDSDDYKQAAEVLRDEVKRRGEQNAELVTQFNSVASNLERCIQQNAELVAALEEIAEHKTASLGIINIARAAIERVKHD